MSLSSKREKQLVKQARLGMPVKNLADQYRLPEEKVKAILDKYKDK